MFHLATSALLSRLLGLVLLLGAASGAHADQGLLERPPGDGGPTVLRTRVLLIDVAEVDSARQTFTGSVFLEVHWQDDRLRHEGPGEVLRDLDEVWAPQFQILNQRAVSRTLPEQLAVTPDGDVSYRQRYWGTFSEPMDLRDFPYDRQEFHLLMIPLLPNIRPGDVDMVLDPELPCAMSPETSLPDWNITSWDAGPISYNPGGARKTDDAFQFTFEAERHSSYYLFKVILPLLLIVAMSWIVFWVDPTNLGPQLSVAVTSMLTLIAYRFAVGNELPKVGYLTRMDLFFLGSTLTVFATLVEAVLTGVLASRDKADLARRIDGVARVVFPTIAVVIVYLTLVH
jgi:hypothetical protein